MCFSISKDLTALGSKRRFAFKIVHEILGTDQEFNSQYSYANGKTRYILGVSSKRLDGKTGFGGTKAGQSDKGYYVYTTLAEARQHSNRYLPNQVIIRVTVKPEDFLRASKYSNVATYRAVKPTAVVI